MNILLAVIAAFSFGDVKVDCPKPESWNVQLRRAVESNGVEVAVVTMDTATPSAVPMFTLSFSVPQKGIHSCWQVNDGSFALPANWAGCYQSTLCRNMPLWVYMGSDDMSRLSVAVSDCANTTTLRGGVREEGSKIELSLSLFESPTAPRKHYEVSFRLSMSERYFGSEVADAVRWIERTGGYRPCTVPSSAFDPLYSSWYCFHQDVSAADIEAECVIASKLGMKTIILDDGWQTTDTNRGYSFCGDWKVSSRRFDDMRAHVSKVHELGMKYMVWYSVPFIGVNSANFERFKGKYLYMRSNDDAGVLDPRFPEVREFLVDTYVTAMEDYGYDGFKLDFIDSFRLWDEDPAVADNYAGRDYKSLPEAVDVLMKQVHDALAKINPEVMIEFRQTYIGPAIRQYGNMLRVGDCPGNMRANRIGIANLRLVSGATAVHADMLEWNFRESAQGAALNVLNSIFGTVQYSVMLRDAPKDHLAMLEHWIGFSLKHRDALLKGAFRPHHPELGYPLIEAESKSERIIGVYDDGRLIDCGKADKSVYVLNATTAKRLTLRLAGAAKISSYDTFGMLAKSIIVNSAGLVDVECPPSGYIEIVK